jgi:hypothetical protein
MSVGISEFTPEFFDASSAAWKENKMRKGHQYIYVCAAKGCVRKPVDDFCSRHASELNAPPAEEKKLTHGYFLRKRSTHAAVL